MRPATLLLPMKERPGRRPADKSGTAAHGYALPDSKANRPGVLSWEAGLACAPAMRLSPEMQVRLLAQRANFHRVADAALYVECLRSLGLGETAARDAYRLLQIALGRCLPAVRGVRFGDLFCRFDPVSRSLDVGCLSAHTFFAAATKLGPGAFSRQAREVIGASSPEAQAALAQIARGVRARRVELRPCLLPAALADAAGVEYFASRADARVPIPSPARATHPWWNRWKTNPTIA
jgi:hypothetical protein